jgi:hypothetical protein
MSEVWNSVYKSDSTFFGEQSSNFALLCFNHMKANNVRKVLELGAGMVEIQYFLLQMELKWRHWTILSLLLGF